MIITKKLFEGKAYSDEQYEYGDVPEEIEGYEVFDKLPDVYVFEDKQFDTIELAQAYIDEKYPHYKSIMEALNQAVLLSSKHKDEFCRNVTMFCKLLAAGEGSELSNRWYSSSYNC